MKNRIKRIEIEMLWVHFWKALMLSIFSLVMEFKQLFATLHFLWQQILSERLVGDPRHDLSPRQKNPKPSMYRIIKVKSYRTIGCTLFQDWQHESS